MTKKCQKFCDTNRNLSLLEISFADDDLTDFSFKVCKRITPKFLKISLKEET